MQKRTKRNYVGVLPTGKKISDLLPGVLEDVKQRRGISQDAVFAFWFSLIGPKMGPYTQPISLKNRMLTIKVKSATMYALLCQYEKPRLLDAMRAKFQVNDLIFRVG